MLRSRFMLSALAMTLATTSLLSPAPTLSGEPTSTESQERLAAITPVIRVRLPIIVTQASSNPPAGSCTAIPGASYASISVASAPTDRPAEQHGDLNLALRGYTPVSAFSGLVDYNGAADPGAPQLPGLFADRRTPAFQSSYQVYDWNWGCNCRGSLITWPQVTLANLATTPGEIISLPGAGPQIGLVDSGFQALVLYASEQRVTLKYTREDNVIQGYTLHLENVCVEPNLLALYRALNAAGRGQLPALRALQPLARARATTIGVAIRDTGQFMDPRSRKDWWQGR